MTGKIGIQPPQDSARDQLLWYLEKTKVVTGVETPEYSVLIIHRDRKSTLKVFITDTYLLSEADVYEVLSRYTDLNAIVNMSVWNRNTLEASEYCKERRVGLFTFKEFLGAINYSGTRFLNYRPKDRD